MTKARSDALARAERRLAEVTGAIDAHAIVAEWNTDGRIRSVNDRFCEASQYSREELIGRHFEEFVLVVGPGAAGRNVTDAIRLGVTWHGEIQLAVRDGSIFWADATVVAVRDFDGGIEYCIGLWSDITELKRAEAAAHQLACFDPVTGLPNRQGLIDDVLPQLAAEAVTRDASVALVVIGLDNFREINDALGYSQGDELLRQVSQRLTTAHPDIAAVARTGEHEFCLVLNELSGEPALAEAEAEVLMRMIRRVLTRADNASELGATSEFSAGISLCGANGEAPHLALERAEIAMHRAKDHGMNQTRVFLPEIHSEMVARLELLADLRQAVRRDELQLFFQPIVDDTAFVSGYECLVRWFHPTRGLVMPDQFIPIADQTGLIHVIGDWVLRRACEQIAVWGSDPALAHLSLSVNVSARQFKDPNFANRVFSIVRQSGADPHRLRIELTESMFHVDLEESVQRIDGLRRAGIRFALDDFGTGYSSLEYLSRLPVQQLKIDRSFVGRIGEEPGDAAIVLMILGLARTLGLQTVAEGIETEAQFDFLREHGCSSFQGYFFGRPAPLQAT